MPTVSYKLEVPTMLVHSERLHNSFVKRVLRVVLEWHWRNRIPKHFTRPAHSLYRYAERSARYRYYKQKKYGSSTDLVRTGRTRHAMTTQHRIRIGGTAAGGTITGKLILRFPFSGGSGRFRKSASRQRVTIEEMIREVQAVADQEAAEIGQQLKDFYLVLVDTETSARQRVTI